MTAHNVKLKKRQEIAEGTMAFHFEKPEGFQFRAGQFLNLRLLEPPETDAEGNQRSFSIASAPDEDELMVATRMRDTAFKRVLKEMLLESEVKMAGPFGAFTLHRAGSRPAVFLTGGIGVTPFRSIVVQATQDKLPHRLFFFYSNRKPEDAAFLDELQQLEAENPNYKLIATMTQIEKSKRAWDGKTGYIDREMLTEIIPDLHAPIYYSAGPPGMVTAMRKMLEDSGVNDDDIRTEDFTGY
jgi:ferredoxin-NADP reductase